MYLFLLKKKPQEQQLLWEKIENKKNEDNELFIKSLVEYISAGGKTKADERRASSCLIYYAFEYLRMIGIIKTFLSLKKDSFGKPYLDGGDVQINLSHTDNMVALIVDEDMTVGVDIEDKIPTERAERLEKRFFTDFDISADMMDKENTDFEGKEMKVLELKNEEFITPVLFPSNNSFTTKWTVAEAIMKCDGKGFSSISDISELSRKTKVFSFIYNNGDKDTYISIALKNKQ